MIEVIRGAVDKPASIAALEEYVNALKLSDGLLYLGYPILGNIEEVLSIDALLISKDFGITIFDVIEEDVSSDRKGRHAALDNILYAKFLQYKDLVKERRELKFEVGVITIAPAWRSKDSDFLCATNQEEFMSLYQNKHSMEREVYKKVLEVIQAVTKLNNKPKRNIVKPDSRGAFLKKIEVSVSNLDWNQNKAVIETANRLQRIRGLAGSGKTIVLALKAAYLHARYPDWNIAVTFHNRALKDQFRDLINKFTIEQKGDEPDWSKIKILQAWGSPKNLGIYYEFCESNNVEYFDFLSAGRIGAPGTDVFDNIVEKALSEVSDVKELYDVILVDEAQDLRESFLKMCYSMLKSADANNLKNKRLIYAYDELQKLDENPLRSPKEIFGREIDFENKAGKPKQDFALEICYRNSKPVLVTAHALGFGIYRIKGLVQMFGEKEVWKDVGYKVKEGELNAGKEVILERDNETSPDFLYSGVDINDLITFKVFSNFEEQSGWIADQIEINLTRDELQPRDIIVIYPDPIKAKNQVGMVRNLLYEKKIKTHLSGVSTSPDNFYQDDSVAFTGIYRAKGNEGAMVYVMDAQYCYDGQELIKKRNILFTAITRSKCWVMVCGFGVGMEKVKGEYEEVKKNSYTLRFPYPSEADMETMSLIHRDLTNVEKRVIEESKKALNKLEKELHSGIIKKEDLMAQYKRLQEFFEKND